jgi:hypothetical protein
VAARNGFRSGPSSGYRQEAERFGIFPVTPNSTRPEPGWCGGQAGRDGNHMYPVSCTPPSPQTNSYWLAVLHRMRHRCKVRLCPGQRIASRKWSTSSRQSPGSSGRMCVCLPRPARVPAKTPG